MDGSASQCRRDHENSVKAKIIQGNMERKAAAKKAKVSGTDLSGWNRKIPRSTHYCGLAKKLCLNLISVRQQKDTIHMCVPFYSYWINSVENPKINCHTKFFLVKCQINQV